MNERKQIMKREEETEKEKSNAHSIEEILEKILQFRDERDWKQNHIPKDLAVSIVLEASELLELFQWRKEEEPIDDRRDRIAEELADVLIYSFQMADLCGLDIAEIIERKMILNAQKYPVPKK